MLVGGAGQDASFKQLLKQSRGPMNHSNYHHHFNGCGIASSIGRGPCVLSFQHITDSNRTLFSLLSISLLTQSIMATLVHDIVTTDSKALDQGDHRGPVDTDIGPHDTARVNGSTNTKGIHDLQATSDQKPTIIESKPDVREFKPVLDLNHTQDADPAERVRRASQIDWLTSQSKDKERRESVIKGVDNLKIPEEDSNPAERARRASQVEWLKRESQIDPMDTSAAAIAAQRERRGSKYPHDVFLGNINDTASPHNKAKKWSFRDGDFRMGMPKKPSNAVAQGVRRDGSVSYEDGLPGPRGLFPNERKSIDANVASDHDKSKKWSFNDGDFKFAMPKKASNAVAQGVRRDGSVSYEDGLPGPRGLFPNERKSIDANVVSKHEKSRKWSFADGDFAFKLPTKPSNADAQGIPGPYTRKSISK
jgi:hypothetical protein